MESALLCASRFVPSTIKHYGEVGAFGRNFHTSFCVQMPYSNSLLSRNKGTARRSHIVIASVLGRKVKKETIIPDPDYRLPVVLLGIAGGLVYVDNLLAAVPVGLLGLLLLVQTTRVRFVFDEEALEVKIGDQLQESGPNAFVGGKSRWKYSTFVNWELWWPNFPILVYFKEKQTKPEGQVHFFPVIFNGKQLYDVMVERCGSSKTSAPK
ncbi:uncharacterized protein LOC111399392 isoform X1 [Olea europaea var. sylvestris]|uniref:uncharacterized protein LOC111399392 isoform X1 n=1 Tax=Olea europaea var. sylvestris TaxID=158386 RepID=UPI000C1D17F3|nr:uncharacterized protein LOC111399392 isoform X1 [Olea europaea var. sylvestris]